MADRVDSHASAPRRACSSPRRRRPRRSFALRGPFGPGVAVYSTLDRHARHAAPLRLELQSVLRHEGAALDRSRQDVQGDEVGAGLPEGRRARARQHLVARAGRRQEGPAVRRRAGVALPEPTTAATPGRWSPASATTSTRASGSPGNGGLCMHTIIRDGNRVHLGISTGGHYLSEDGGETFKASNKGVGAGFTPDPYPEFGQCVHKIARPRRRARPALHAEPRRLGRVGRPRRTAAGHRRAAQRRPRPARGARSPRGCRRTSASRSSSTRTTPTRST